MSEHLRRHQRDAVFTDVEALAIGLARDTGQLHGMRETLRHSKARMFDAALHAKRIEAAFEAMYQRQQAGVPPDHMDIAPQE